MDKIHFRCPNNHPLKAPAAAAGRTMRCPAPGCGATVTVPRPGPATGDEFLLAPAAQKAPADFQFDLTDERPAPKAPAQSSPLQPQAAPVRSLVGDGAAGAPAAPPAPTNGGQPDDDWEALCATARPELYRGNAFRVAKLFVEATAEEAKKEVAATLARRKAGAAGKPGGLLPLRPVPDEAALREALRRLGDPGSRLLDEFFWFWPLPPDRSPDDDALAALACGDSEQACEHWNPGSLTGEPRDVAMHNLAVLHHALALDGEYADQTKRLSEEGRTALDEEWAQAYLWWGKVLDRPAVWQRVAARARELKHPTLPDDAAGLLRRGLPGLLLRLHLALVTKRVEDGDPETALRHVRILAASGLSPTPVQQAFQRSAAEVYQRIQALRSQAELQAQADPPHADAEAQKFLDAAEPLTELLGELVPKDDPAREVAGDLVALGVLKCLEGFTRATEHWQAALKLLVRAQGLAATEAAKRELKAFFKEGAAHAREGDQWCAPGYHDLPEELLRDLEEARALAAASKWQEAIDRLNKLSDGWVERMRQTTGQARPQSLFGKLRAAFEETFARSDYLVRKPQAYCMHRVAMARLAPAATEFLSTPIHMDPFDAARVGQSHRALQTRLRKQADLERPGNMLARSLFEVRPPSLECAGCGWANGDIEKFTCWKVGDVECTICSRCFERQANEEEARNKTFRAAVKAVADELTLAHTFDPDNNVLRENLEKVKLLLASELHRPERVRDVLDWPLVRHQGRRAPQGKAGASRMHAVADAMARAAQAGAAASTSREALKALTKMVDILDAAGPDCADIAKPLRDLAKVESEATALATCRQLAAQLADKAKQSAQAAAALNILGV